MLELGEPRALQQRLVYRNRLPDLTFFPVQVAEDHVYFESVGVQTRGARQFLDGEIDLVGDEEVQPENEMGRLSRAPAVYPLAAPQLVALPCLADGESGKQRQQRSKQG